MRFGQLSQSGDTPCDRVLSDDAAAPALLYEVITRYHFAPPASERHEHLHDARLQSFGLIRRQHLTGCGAHEQTAERELAFPSQIDLHSALNGHR
jgi:hypothetical protein